ncbi:hypothetical protein LPJ73_005838 [Coemansia sp. RSA 2703]|nr:hypothetical protein LPJ73_005838 [Coemansia sp. RSA 2703]KAJ2376043.1 hypothetical protein IW150_002203 [Coemansia sp. RSA 2607]
MSAKGAGYRPPLAPQAVHSAYPDAAYPDATYAQQGSRAVYPYEYEHRRSSQASSGSIDSIGRNNSCFRRFTIQCCDSLCCCCCCGRDKSFSAGPTRGGATYTGCGFSC